MKNYIGLNIKYLIDKNFLSQGKFGELFGLTQAVINAYIKEKSNPQVETIQKICAHFKISIDDFFNKDMSKEGYLPATGSLPQAIEQGVEYQAQSKDKIISAQEKLIASLEKQIERLEKERDSGNFATGATA